MGLGWTRAPVGAAERCRIPLQTWHLATAGPFTGESENFCQSLYSEAINARHLKKIAPHIQMHKHISGKQMLSATYNIRILISISIESVFVFEPFSHYRAGKAGECRTCCTSGEIHDK